MKKFITLLIMSVIAINASAYIERIKYSQYCKINDGTANKTITVYGKYDGFNFIMQYNVVGAKKGYFKCVYREDYVVELELSAIKFANCDINLYTIPTDSIEYVNYAEHYEKSRLEYIETLKIPETSNDGQITKEQLKKELEYEVRYNSKEMNKDFIKAAKYVVENYNSPLDYTTIKHIEYCTTIGNSTSLEEGIKFAIKQIK